VSGHIITPAGEIRYIVAHHVPESAVEGGWLLCIYSDREIREDT
jgi:hypothetical protein